MTDVKSEETPDFQELKNKTRKDIEDENSSTLQLSLVPYWFLAILRVVLTLVPQIGYIHPDEYFQSIEVVSGDIYEIATNRPWEFNATFPIRSVTLPYIIVGLPLYALKIIAPFMALWFSINTITPYTLLVVPRLACCLLSFITDVCLYKICNLYGQNYRTRLLTLASSYVVLVYGTRTFTNTFEMFLCSLLIYLVAKSMARSDRIMMQDEFLRECYNASVSMRDKVRYHRLRLSLPWHSFSNVVFIALVTVLGVFNRPTFLAFALPPLFFWLQRGLGPATSLRDFNIRTLALAICAAPPAFFLILVDSVYYGYFTWEEFYQRKVSLDVNFVVTPYNFLVYNLNSTNLASHGVHPHFTHFLINVPLLFNILGAAGLFAFLHIVYRMVVKRWSELPRVQSIIGLMTGCFLVPIAVLSVFAHQEARFLIPVTLPLIFLHAQRLRPSTSTSVMVTPRGLRKPPAATLLSVWYTINMLATLFLGFMHQAGVYPLVMHLSKEMESKPRLTALHIVTSHIYPLPTSLLQLKYGRLSSTNGTRYTRTKDFLTHELGSSHRMDIAAAYLHSLVLYSEAQWLQKRTKYRIYFAVPSSLMEEFQLEAFRLNITVSLERIFYPHVSTEALPTLRPLHCPDRQIALTDWPTCETEPTLAHYLDFNVPLKYLSQISHQFGLSLFAIKK